MGPLQNLFSPITDMHRKGWTIDSFRFPFKEVNYKTVQGNLAHATAAFTLDVYGHVTNQMQEASAIRMEAYIKGILNL